MTAAPMQTARIDISIRQRFDGWWLEVSMNGVRLEDKDIGPCASHAEAERALADFKLLMPRKEPP